MASVIIVDINLRILRVGEGCHALPRYRIQRLVLDVRICGSIISTQGQAWKPAPAEPVSTLDSPTDIQQPRADTAVRPYAEFVNETPGRLNAPQFDWQHNRWSSIPGAELQNGISGSAGGRGSPPLHRFVGNRFYLLPRAGVEAIPDKHSIHCRRLFSPH